MWRAVLIGGLLCVGPMNASVAEDVCVSVPNGIMCGPIVPNPGVAIRPSAPPSQLPASDERSDVRPDSGSQDRHDQRREMQRDNQREGRRGEPNYGRRLYSHRSYRPSSVREPLHDSIHERRYTRRGKGGSFEHEGMVGDRDRHHHRFQSPDERRFDNGRDSEQRGRRGERQLDDRYRYAHRTYERRFERPVPRHNRRYYDRRWD
jgi:hypothetical protein